MNMFKKNGGFTLVELIVVIAILAILAAVAVPAYSGYINKANDAADTTALGAVKTAALAATATVGETKAIKVETNADGAMTAVVAIVKTGVDADTDEDILKSYPLYAGSYDGTSDAEKDFALFMNKATVTLKGELKDADCIVWVPADLTEELTVDGTAVVTYTEGTEEHAAGWSVSKTAISAAEEEDPEETPAG